MGMTVFFILITYETCRTIEKDTVNSPKANEGIILCE